MKQESRILGLLHPVHGAIRIGKILDDGWGYRALQSGGGSGLATQDKEPASACTAFTSPSIASALLSKHRPRCSEFVRNSSRITSSCEP